MSNQDELSIIKDLAKEFSDRILESGLTNKGLTCFLGALTFSSMPETMESVIEFQEEFMTLYLKWYGKLENQQKEEKI